MSRIYNFNPGPSTLPLPVLEKCREELTDYRGSGMSVMELSHRSGEFTEIIQNAKQNLRDLLEIPDNYHILFLGGGASLRFAMIPLNFLPPDGGGDYLVTGTWAKKAVKEAQIIGRGNTVASSEETGFDRIPRPEEWRREPGAAYFHITSNNTIFGTQLQDFPDPGETPLICDMSSDILSRKIPVEKFSLIYAGAQKNLGPAGVTVVILREELAARANKNLPTMLAYSTHVGKESLFNTPPVYPIYVLGLVLEWVKDQGGLAALEERNHRKADLLYNCIDESSGFYRGTAQRDSRSRMNITFRLGNQDLEKNFLSEAASRGLKGLKGHRSVGGIRASIYNAMPVEGVEKLVAFMEEFRRRY